MSQSIAELTPGRRVFPCLSWDACEVPTALQKPSASAPHRADGDICDLTAAPSRAEDCAKTRVWVREESGRAARARTLRVSGRGAPGSSHLSCICPTNSDLLGLPQPTAPSAPPGPVPLPAPRWRAGRIAMPTLFPSRHGL